MFCTTCLSKVEEIGSDIFVNDSEELVEESQMQCVACGAFGSIFVVNCSTIEYFGVYESPSEVMG